MSSSTASLNGPSLAKGTYSAPTASDLRSPCPMVNSLANHGYISRDGRNVLPKDLVAGLGAVGISSALSATFANPIFLERKEPEQKKQRSRSILGYLWYLIRNPWALLFSKFGMRMAGQKDPLGRKCLNLDQLNIPDLVEHDISLTRTDIAQGDNTSPQPELIQELLAASSDGKTFTAADLTAHRRRRIEEQRKQNPAVNYGANQDQIGAAEIALILHVLGDGSKVPHDYVKAFFQEERLPYREGWTGRRWWTLGFLELGKAVKKMKALVGTKIE